MYKPSIILISTYSLILLSLLTSCKPLNLINSAKYEEVDKAFDILQEMSNDLQAEIHDKSFNYTSEWSKCQNYYNSLDCNQTAIWQKTLEINNQSKMQLNSNRSSLVSEIDSLETQITNIRNQTNDSLNVIETQISTIKLDIHSINVIRGKFIGFCIKKQTNLTLMDKDDIFSSIKTKQILEFTMKSLLQVKSPGQMNKTAEEMFREEKDILLKVIKLLKTLKKNLIGEIKKLKAQIKTEESLLKTKIEGINLEIKERQAKIKEIESKISQNDHKINDLLKKLDACEKGKDNYSECESKKDKNDRFIENLKEEDQLIKNLLDLITQFT